MEVDTQTPTQTEGASGAPATPVAAGSQSDDELLASLEKPAPAKEDTPAWKEHLDFLEKLPESEKRKVLAAMGHDTKRVLEEPFLIDHTKKSQILADQARENERRSAEREAKLLSIVENQMGRPASDTEKQQLLEQIQAGDPAAIDTYIKRSIDEQIAPMRNQVTATNAINEALSLVGQSGREHLQGAIAAIDADPVLTTLANADNRKYAGRVIAGLVYQREAATLRAENAKLKEDREVYAKETAKRAVEAMKARASGMPTSTSRAGTTGTASPQKGAMSFKEAARAAAIELGLPDEWRP